MCLYIVNPELVPLCSIAFDPWRITAHSDTLGHTTLPRGQDRLAVQTPSINEFRYAPGEAKVSLRMRLTPFAIEF